MTTSKPLVFFGNEQLATGLEGERTPIFDALIAGGYTVAAVILRPDAPRGRSKTPVPSLIKTKALELGIPILQPAKLSDILPELQKFKGYGGVLASYGRLVPQSVIDIFEPIGIINIHPSLLPRYRGSTPIESALLAGDSETGVSLMRLSAGMDEGDIFTQTTVALGPHTTKQQAYEALSRAGAESLITNLPRILSGALTASPQASEGISYSSMLSKSDGALDPAVDDAPTLEHKIRAYAGFPKARLVIDGTSTIVTAASVVNSPETPLTITCRDRTYLRIDELVAPSGKKMNAEAFIRGYKK